MSTTIVTVFLNEGPGMFAYYRPGEDRLRKLDVELVFDDPEPYNVMATLRDVWAVGNKARTDDHGTAYPETERSLSIGDVVLLSADDAMPFAWAVSWSGWDPARRFDIEKSVESGEAWEATASGVALVKALSKEAQ